MPPKLHVSRGGFGCSSVSCARAKPPASAKATAAEVRAVLKRIIVRCPSGSVAVQASAAAGFLASTASAIEAGMGFVLSVKLRTGMITRKKPKYPAVRNRAIKVRASVGSCDPTQPSPTQITTNTQKKNRNAGRYLADLTGLRSSQGMKARTAIAENSA